MNLNKTTIFTDGASKGNPGPGGWGTVVVDGGTVSELGGYEEHTTNNRMELTAALKALEFVASYDASKNIAVYTDSNYLINGITKWVSGWKKNNWMTKTKEAVMNRDLWEEIDALCQNRNVEWIYVGGHVGVAGNERCDEIATAFADGEKIHLYKGPLENYSVKKILDISSSDLLHAKKDSAKSRSKARAHSYVSLVEGRIEVHQTWVECEARVKGKPNVKFKKALTPLEEREIIASWNQ
jgi:ribonuclease HI